MQVRVGRKSRWLLAGAFRHLPAAFGGRRDKAAFPPYLLINDTLRRVIEGEHIEADLHSVIREELAQRFG